MNYIDIFLIGFAIIIVIMVAEIIYLRLKNLGKTEQVKQSIIKIKKERKEKRKIVMVDARTMHLIEWSD